MLIHKGNQEMQNYIRTALDHIQTMRRVGRDHASIAVIPAEYSIGYIAARIAAAGYTVAVTKTRNIHVAW
jgi:hypothetical protein